MTYYFVTNEEGDRVRDKDGYDYIEWDELTPYNFDDYAYRSEQPAEGHIFHYDPEGSYNMQVVEREVTLDLE